MTKPEIEVRECETLEELAECVQLQRDVFAKFRPFVIWS
jgi:hypothetical protein